MQYPTVQTEMCLRIKQLTKLTTKSHSRALPDTPFSFNITTSDVLLHVVNYSLHTGIEHINTNIFVLCVCVCLSPQSQTASFLCSSFYALMIVTPINISKHI